jgi:hypothetical protein
MCSRSRKLKAIQTFFFAKVTEFDNIWYGHGMRRKFERGNDDLEKLKGQINSKKEKTMIKITKLTIIIFAALFCYTGVAQAQWVFLGRKALGAVNRFTSQGHEKQGQGFDVATVLLEANAEKVYSTAVDLLKGNPNLTINYREDRGRQLEFTDGRILVGMKVSRLEDNLSELLVSSTITPGHPSDTSFVVEKVFQVCEKVGVHCTLAKD